MEGEIKEVSKDFDKVRRARSLLIQKVIVGAAKVEQLVAKEEFVQAKELFEEMERLVKEAEELDEEIFTESDDEDVDLMEALRSLTIEVDILLHRHVGKLTHEKEKDEQSRRVLGAIQKLGREKLKVSIIRRKKNKPTMGVKKPSDSQEVVKDKPDKRDGVSTMGVAQIQVEESNVEEVEEIIVEVVGATKVGVEAVGKMLGLGEVHEEEVTVEGALVGRFKSGQDKFLNQPSIPNSLSSSLPHIPFLFKASEIKPVKVRGGLASTAKGKIREKTKNVQAGTGQNIGYAFILENDNNGKSCTEDRCVKVKVSFQQERVLLSRYERTENIMRFESMKKSTQVSSEEIDRGRISPVIFAADLRTGQSDQNSSKEWYSQKSETGESGDLPRSGRGRRLETQVRGQGLSSPRSRGNVHWQLCQDISEVKE